MAGKAKFAEGVLDPNEFYAFVFGIMHIVAGRTFHPLVPEKVGDGESVCVCSQERRIHGVHIIPPGFDFFVRKPDRMMTLAASAADSRG